MDKKMQDFEAQYGTIEQALGMVPGEWGGGGEAAGDSAR